VQSSREVPEGVRLFLALDLPEGARTALARWRDSVVPGRDELRPVPDEALHVTLVFLGRRPRDYVERVWKIAAGSLGGLAAPHLTAAGAAWVPPRRSRVLALDLEDRGARAASVQESLR
jgi:2'-5' RNA ligase